MKLRRITLENVRQFTAPVEVAGIDPADMRPQSV